MKFFQHGYVEALVMVLWDNVFGLYQKALSIREDKLDLISANIANQDTPNYKARDIDFKEAIQSAGQNLDQQLQLKTSNQGGLQGLNSESQYPVKYRIPSTESLDGNTVGQSTEKFAFMRNVVRYNSTVAFIEAKKAALMEVIKGE